MTHWDARAQALLEQARLRRTASAGTRSRVKASVAASVALSATAGATAVVASSQTAFAKLPAAVKAASALSPAATGVVGLGSIAPYFAPVFVGVTVGLSAITPSEVTQRAPIVAPHVSRTNPRVGGDVAKPLAPPVPLQRPSIELKTEDLSVRETATQPPVKSSMGVSSLAAEVDLLERARLVLRQDDPSLAIDLLDQHRREFPRGALFFEALATRAIALCKLGQMETAIQVLSRLEATAVNSGLAAQVRASCGLSSASRATGREP